MEKIVVLFIIVLLVWMADAITKEYIEAEKIKNWLMNKFDNFHKNK